MKNMFEAIKNKVKAFVVKKASANKMIDIVEVRTKNVGLTSVTTETDIRIKNSLFLPITILSIQTELFNRDGLKVGRMSYQTPQKIKGNGEEILTTQSEISIITSIFQAITSFLSQSISMRSIGVAQVKFLWWVFEIPVNDFFEIHPSKLKIVKPETEEERILRLQKEAKWKEKYKEIKDKKKEERKEKRAEWKEDVLKRRYMENYIPKEERDKKKTELIITNLEEPNNENIKHVQSEGTLDVVLDEKVINTIIEEMNLPADDKTDDTLLQNPTA